MSDHRRPARRPAPTVEEHRTGELDLCKQLEVVNLGEVGVTLGDLLNHAISGVEGLEPAAYEGGVTQFKTSDGRWWCVLYEVHLRQLARPTCDECDAKIDPAEVGQEGPERVLCRRCRRCSTTSTGEPCKVAETAETPSDKEERE
ncbi:MAG TPA: hypothetical protein VH877_26135 [Polyangia bacterium]|jgi:hypothetical protein|nr:hypothetical protein [Polyangia bacterium]